MFQKSLILLAVVLVAQTAFATETQSEVDSVKKLSYKTPSSGSSSSSNAISQKLKDAESQIADRLSEGIRAIRALFDQGNGDIDALFNLKFEKIKALFDQLIANLHTEAGSAEQYLAGKLTSGQKQIGDQTQHTEDQIISRVEESLKDIDGKVAEAQSYIHLVGESIIEDLSNSIADTQAEFQEFINSQKNVLAALVAESINKIKYLIKQCKKSNQVAPPIQLILPQKLEEEIHEYKTSTAYYSPTTRQTRTTTKRTTPEGTPLTRPSTTTTTQSPSTITYTTPVITVPTFPTETTTDFTTSPETTITTTTPYYPPYYPPPQPYYPQPQPYPAYPPQPAYGGSSDSIYTSLRKKLYGNNA